MGAQSRRDLIESLVTSHGEIDFASLATEFGVSEMTIRRDVDALENKGVLRRVVGGAISLAGKSAEPSFKDRSTAATLAKMRIADATAGLLVPNETVIIDSGSTALGVARASKGRGLGRRRRNCKVVIPCMLYFDRTVDAGESMSFVD